MKENYLCRRLPILYVKLRTPARHRGVKDQYLQRAVSVAVDDSLLRIAEELKYRETVVRLFVFLALRRTFCCPADRAPQRGAFDDPLYLTPPDASACSRLKVFFFLVNKQLNAILTGQRIPDRAQLP